MKSCESNGMKGTVYVDEFNVGGKEENKHGRSYNTKKKKIICALETKDDSKVKRFYTEKIKYFSIKSLKKIFEKYIDKTANVLTDEWKGYRPIQFVN